MVCDYRAVNRVMVPDATPLSLVDETLQQVAGATIFSQKDLIGAYYQMRIKYEDCHKTAIYTHFGARAVLQALQRPRSLLSPQL